MDWHEFQNPQENTMPDRHYANYNSWGKQKFTHVIQRVIGVKIAVNHHKLFRFQWSGFAYTSKVTYIWHIYKNMYFLFSGNSRIIQQSERSATTFGLRFFSHASAKPWNDLQNCLKEMTDFHEFKPNFFARDGPWPDFKIASNLLKLSELWDGSFSFKYFKQMRFLSQCFENLLKQRA